ncbi:MAG: Wzz/FepE/Etk N-terminal domain-containing protein, partial [Cyanobacteria bacterium P01_G01_bin.4]
MSIDTYVEEFDFGEFRTVLKRHWLPAAVAFVSLPALAVAYLFLKSPTYMAQGKILVGVDRKASLTGVAEEVGSIENLAFDDNPVNSQLEILQSVVVIGDTINELRLRDGDGELLSTNAFRQELTTTLIAGTDVIEIGYRSSDPEQAAEIVNTLIDMYLRNNAEVNQGDVIRAREFIENQLPRSEATVQEAETALRQFREQNGILDLQQESAATSTRLSTL